MSFDFRRGKCIIFAIRRFYEVKSCSKSYSWHGAEGLPCHAKWRTRIRRKLIFRQNCLTIPFGLSSKTSFSDFEHSFARCDTGRKNSARIGPRTSASENTDTRILVLSSLLYARLKSNIFKIKKWPAFSPYIPSTRYSACAGAVRVGQWGPRNPLAFGCWPWEGGGGKEIAKKGSDD